MSQVRVVVPATEAAAGDEGALTRTHDTPVCLTRHDVMVVGNGALRGAWCAGQPGDGRRQCLSGALLLSNNIDFTVGASLAERTLDAVLPVLGRASHPQRSPSGGYSRRPTRRRVVEGAPSPRSTRPQGVAMFRRPTRRREAAMWRKSTRRREGVGPGGTRPRATWRRTPTGTSVRSTRSVPQLPQRRRWPPSDVCVTSLLLLCPSFHISSESAPHALFLPLFGLSSLLIGPPHALIFVDRALRLPRPFAHVRCTSTHVVSFRAPSRTRVPLR